MNSFSFSPNRSVKEPLYEQLYHAFANKILSGEIPFGERLPSKRALSAQLHLSLSTVETAYSVLLSEGYIISKPRIGYFVCMAERASDIKLYSKSQGFAYKPPSSLINPTIYALGRKNMRTSLIYFSIGANDTSTFPYATWAKTTKTVVYDMSNLSILDDPQGDISLRTAITKMLYETRGIRCSPEQIIIGPGIEYLLDTIIQLFGEKAIYAFENPFYKRAIDIMHNHHSKIRLINIDNAGVSPKELEQSDATILFVTPSHQVPMGITMPIGRRMQLLNWAVQRNAYIIEDDFDSEFHYVTRSIPALQSFDRFGRVIFFGTFLRSIAPSIRTSYLVLPENLLPAYYAKFRYYSASVSLIEQLTLSRFITEGHLARHIRRMSLRYKKKRDLLIGALQSEFFGANMKISGEHAGLHFILMPNIGFSEKELKQRALTHGVLLNGLSEYCMPDFKIPEPTLMFGYGGLSEEEIVKGVNLLGEAWK